MLDWIESGLRVELLSGGWTNLTDLPFTKHLERGIKKFEYRKVNRVGQK